MKIRKAVIPAAGFGTRFLPFTKTTPKEMISIVDKPAIQYIIEEAVASGIEEVLIVLSRGKEAIINHFDETPELDQLLEDSGKTELLKLSQEAAHLAKIQYVRQGLSKGLGHAILCAKSFVGDEPFVVLLPDDLVDSQVPAIQQLIETHQRYGGTVLGVQPVPKEEVSKYGIIKGRLVAEDTYEIETMVEKPEIDEAPSELAVLGRYVLMPGIFEMIEKTPPGKGGEIQLTDSINQQIETEKVYARVFEGNRYDTGNKLGYLEATLNYGLKHPEVGEAFKELLSRLNLD
ncbi:MAG: UTP--glucose-1-phosphate uridylyltransferase [delta proteobacterium ML8_F1]|nr:MAG: UTP--glucose-1-phosphate uridylyltransferase [delta proteobacterium ML8_F1]